MAPRRANTKDELLFADTIVDKYVSAADARSSREKVWDDARKRFDPQWTDPTVVKKKPKVKGGYVFRNVQTKVSNLLTSAEANGRWVVARSTTPEDGAVGEIVTMYLERQFRRSSSSVGNNNEEAVERMARTGILYGNSYVHVSWFEEEDDWGCRIKNIDPFDVFPDWRDDRWYILRRWVTLRDLMEIASEVSAPSGDVIGTDPETGEEIIDMEPSDGGRAIRVAKQIEREIKSGARNNNIDRDYYSQTANQRQHNVGRVPDSDDGTDPYIDPSDDPYNARVLILEYFETKRDGAIARIIPGLGGTPHLIFQMERNPYGVCPIVPFTPVPVDNEVYGYGEAEIVGHLAECMDSFLRASMRTIARVGDPTLLIQSGIRLRRETANSPSGKYVEVPSVTESMRYMDVTVDPSLMALGSSLAKQWADLATGESEQRRGNTGGSSSATEVAVAESASQTNDRLVHRRFRRSVEQIGRVMLEISKVRMRRETAIPYLGRDADEFLLLKPPYLKGSFEVTFGGSSRGVNPRQEVAELLNVAQTFGPTGTVDLNATLYAVLLKMGHSNPSQFMVNKVQRPKQRPESENIAVFDHGQEIVVHPEDDDMRHLKSHARAVDAEKAMPPGELNIPAIMEMEEHMRLHVVSYQQKMAPMAGAGAPPMGGANGMPSTGPGEQQVVTDAGQNAAADRQNPNQQAAGMAPGGVVPNRRVGQIAYGGPQR